MPQQPVRGPIETAMRGKKAKERAQVKSSEIARAVKAAGRRQALLAAQEARPDHVYTIDAVARTMSVEVWSIEAVDETVRMLLVIEGGAVAFENPLIVHNPPVLVPDGTWRMEIDEEGIEYQAPNYREDAVEALRLIIQDTIRVIRR